MLKGSPASLILLGRANIIDHSFYFLSIMVGISVPMYYLQE